MVQLLAIDPGANGGFAWMDDSVIRAEAMPCADGDVVQRLYSLKATSNYLVAYVEDIPKFCGVGIPGSRIFVMARNFGFILGALAALNIRTIMVPPKIWQEPLHLGGRKSCASQSEWKRKLLGEAQRRYPDVDNVTLKTCDALLILDYARRAEFC